MSKLEAPHLLTLVRKIVKEKIRLMEETIEDLAETINADWYVDVDHETDHFPSEENYEKMFDTINKLNEAMSKNIVFETPIPEEYLNNIPWDKNDVNYVSIYSTIFNMIEKSLKTDLRAIKEVHEEDEKKRDRKLLRQAAFHWDTPESIKKGKNFMEHLLDGRIDKALSESVKDIFGSEYSLTKENDQIESWILEKKEEITDQIEKEITDRALRDGYVELDEE